MLYFEKKSFIFSGDKIGYFFMLKFKAQKFGDIFGYFFNFFGKIST